MIAYKPIERKVLLQNHPVLDAMEQKYGKTKSQIAINWLISQENIVTIPKSINEVHLQENLGALGWELSPEDMELLKNTDFTGLKEF
ncbi:aldo/keto reductase [Candidatus Gracilibacteria bacterium]|nr:aldo/keto reductase [Candidatus Gracilibacteria bacterium]